MKCSAHASIVMRFPPSLPDFSSDFSWFFTMIPPMRVSFRNPKR